MKVNKPKSPFIGGADAPDEKDIAKAVKGEKFAETLSALSADGPTGDASLNSTREALARIASRADLSNDGGTAEALQESAAVLVKSRLSDKFKETAQSEKMIGELSEFVSDDPFLRSKLLSVLQKLRDGAP